MTHRGGRFVGGGGCGIQNVLTAFVGYACADDWQVIATCVDRGEVVLEAVG